MWLRISAIVLRHLYVYRRSWVRVIEAVFWPAMDLLVWGFVTMYLSHLTLPTAVTFMLGGMLLWDVFFRAQQGITLSVLQEMWVGNLVNIFVSPIRTGELVAATAIVGFLRAMVTALVVGVLAYAFYGFNFLAIGLPILPFFFLLLLFGWSMGMVTTAMILRHGVAAEALAWAIPFLVQPFAAVFYPVSVFPAWLKPVAYALPLTYVFEGMRQVVANQSLDWRLLAFGTVLNAIFFVAASMYFNQVLVRVRREGQLTRTGGE